MQLLSCLRCGHMKQPAPLLKCCPTTKIHALKPSKLDSKDHGLCKVHFGAVEDFFRAMKLGIGYAALLQLCASCLLSEVSTLQQQTSDNVCAKNLAAMK
eukprot:3289173-Amphidinium_carterae.1